MRSQQPEIGNYLIRRRFQVGLQVPATILKIIGERIGRRVLDNEQRSYFVSCFAFVRLLLGFATLLLKLVAARAATALPDAPAARSCTPLTSRMFPVDRGGKIDLPHCFDDSALIL